MKLRTKSIFFCELYESWRIKLFTENEKYAYFKELDTQSKILFLINSIDPTVCRKTADFAHNCMNYRLCKIIIH